MPRCIPRLIYVDHATWCAFEKATNGKRHLEPITTILNMLWCHWPYQRTCYLSTSNERCLLWIFEWFYGLLHWWHPHFLKKHGGLQASCTSNFGKASKSWTLCQIEKMWFQSIWNGNFLSYVIFGDGIHMDLPKVQTIVD
jgi:hypothetical protein